MAEDSAKAAGSGGRTYDFERPRKAMAGGGCGAIVGPTDSQFMATVASSRRRSRYLSGALIAAFVLPLYGCFFAIATSPTSLSQANIIVIVRTDGSGHPVVGAAVRVAGTGASDLGRGLTDGNGQFASAIGKDVRNVRVVVDAPTGFVAPTTRARSVEVEVPPGAEQVTVLLVRE